jgi:hypothetical protein
LPEDIEVGCNFTLDSSKIKSLPENLEVSCDLNLTNCPIRLLPKGLKVWGTLYIAQSPLAKLSDEVLLNMIKPDGFIKMSIKR